jgi:hypothetical protein
MKRLTLSVAAALLAAGTWQLAAAATAALPPAHHAGDITYLSGGVGSDQSAAIKSAMHHYPLVLEFVGKTTNNGNEYLADVPVKLTDPHGATLLRAKADGPFMLLSLPKGRYVITARHDGKTERRMIDIGANTHAHEMFVWSM